MCDECGQRIAEKATRAKQQCGGGRLAHGSGGSEERDFQAAERQRVGERRHRGAVRAVAEGIEEGRVECIAGRHRGEPRFDRCRFEGESLIARPSDDAQEVRCRPS